MPKLRKTREDAAETPPAETQLRTGTKLAAETQLHNYEALETELNEPVEIDISDSQDDSAPEAPREEKPRRQDEAPLATQARESKQAEEALQRAQAESQRRQQEAYQAYQRSQTQLAQERRAREQADYDSVVAHIGSAQSDYEAAQRDYVAARHANDFAAEADAQGRMARSQARLVQLEQGKEDMEAARNNPEPEPPQAHAPQASQRSPSEIVNSMTALIPEERQWLLEHPELVTNPQRVQELQGTYAAAQRQGLARGTPEYFQFFEERLGLSEEPERPTKSAKPVRAQAPVSRTTTDLRSGRTNDGNKVTLTAQQRQAAQWSNISEHEYAVQLKKMQDLKRQGYYTDSQ